MEINKFIQAKEIRGSSGIFNNLLDTGFKFDGPAKISSYANLTSIQSIGKTK